MTNNSVDFNVPYIEVRNRGTVAVRLLMAFPHMVVMGFWNYWNAIIGVVQWFIILFTGKRNEAIWTMQNNWLGYATRVMTYLGLMHDEFPPFGTDAGNVPVTYQFSYSADANRLSNGLRLFWIIPAAIISMVMTIVAELMAIVAWFAIIITGTMPRGIYDFSLKAHRMAIRTQSYGALMTDEYPNSNA